MSHTITRADLLSFARQHRFAVECTVSTSGGPQAAVIGIAVTDSLEIIFDTVTSTRKAMNLAESGRIAFVIGGVGEAQLRTLQYEGVARQVAHDEKHESQNAYFRVFPDGRERLSWPGLVYFRASPRWIRYSDFSTEPATIIELTEAEIVGLE